MVRNSRNGSPRYAIEFRDVSRRFVLHHERRASFQDWFIGLIRPRGVAEEFWALRDVSFGIHYGETFGLIGRNGAGKSTLLKLVTRILEPSSGSIAVNGRTYAMLELGAGFHPELSGRDNIFLNGSLYGFSRKEMQQKYDAIVRFAELERFVDMPVKHYSSGMFARLGFGIAINMEPEILVIDEVLAVGDHAFQQKCLRALEELKARGTTILFVSHEAGLVQGFCDRAALLVQGQLVDIGPADDVVEHYFQLLSTDQQEFSLLRVRALDALGIPTEDIHAGDKITIESLIRVPTGQTPDGLTLEIAIDRMGGTRLWELSTSLPATLPAADLGGRRAEDAPDTRAARIALSQLPVGASQLRILASLNDPAGQLIDRAETVIDVRVSDLSQRGLLSLQHEWEWQQAPSELPTTTTKPH